MGFFLLAIQCAYSYNLTVKVYEEGSGKVVNDMDVHLIDPQGMGVMSAQPDSLSGFYEFHDVPLVPLAVFFIHDDKQYAQPLSEPVRELSMYVAPPTGLQEIVVQGDSRYISDDKNLYVPSKQEKAISAGGTDLISAMSIASLRVSPVDNRIQTSMGENVSTFIDFLPATPMDLENMRVSDVIRVETYDFPKDPRFRGAEHVVNFIMRKYEYGGYTKAQAFQSFIDNTGSYSISSRAAYKRMTYDLTAGATYFDRNHEGENSRAIYNFGKDVIVRDRKLDYSKVKSDTWFVSLRALYAKENMTLSNILGLTGVHVPENRTRYLTEYSSFLKNSVSDIYSDSKNISPSWTGEYQFSLPKGYYLVVTPSASYSSNRLNTSFNESGFGIVNDVREDAWDYSLFLTMMKRLGKQRRQGIQMSFYGVGTGNNLTYSGTVPSYVKGRDYTVGLNVQGNLEFGKFWANIGLSAFYNRSKVNAESNNQFTPSCFLASGYRFNAHNALTVSYQQNNNVLPMSQRGSNMILENELDAVMGNPYLKVDKVHRVAIDYTWIPTQRFSMQFSGAYNGLYHPTTMYYYPFELNGRPMMMRTYVDNGTYNSWKYGAAASLRLFEGILSMRCGVYHMIVNRKGLYEGTLSSLNIDGSVQANYRNFFCRIAYVMQHKDMTQNNYVRYPHVLDITAGWGNGDWHASVSLRNPFRTGWTTYRKWFESDSYSEFSCGTGNSRHISVAVNVAYTISYGKKVERGDEVGQQRAVRSGILE